MGTKNKRSSFGELDGATREELLDLLNPVSYIVKTDKFWAFKNAPAGTGLVYYGGYYNFFSGNDTFTTSVNFGNSTLSWGAHFFVVLGAAAADALQITVSGPSISDEGVLNPVDSEAINCSGGVLNSYFETAKKWVGQVSVIVTAGTPVNCNYGYTKYWDNMNTDFKIIGVEATWLGGANDANINIGIRHHKATGWSYRVGTTPVPPLYIADIDTVQASLYDGVRSTSNGAWKRTDLDVDIAGSNSEGTIIEVTNSVNRAFELGMVQLQIQVTQEATLI